MDEDGLTNSAILLMSIGEEQAAEVFKYLQPKEVQKLGETMAKLKSVERDKVEDVLGRFREAAGAQSSLVADTNEFVRSVLNRALGEERAGFLVDRILQGRDVSGIEGLKWMEPGTIAELIKNEHPQIIATILVHLERDHASAILKFLPERTRNEAVTRIATLEAEQLASGRREEELRDLRAALASANAALANKTAEVDRIAGERGALEVAADNFEQALDEARTSGERTRQMLEAQVLSLRAEKAQIAQRGSSVCA